MYDRRLTMLGLALLGATLLLYYMEEGDGFRYSYVTGVAMLAVFGSCLLELAVIPHLLQYSRMLGPLKGSDRSEISTQK